MPPNQFAIRELVLNSEKEVYGELAIFLYENEISLKTSYEKILASPLLPKETDNKRSDYAGFFIGIESLPGEQGNIAFEIYHFSTVRCNALIYARVPFPENLAYDYLNRLDDRLDNILCK